MSINDFKSDLHNKINASESIQKEAFLEEINTIFNEADILEGTMEYVFFETTGSSKRKIRVDGYFYNELDECLLLFISSELFADRNLTITETKKLISNAEAYIKDIDYILKNAEESSLGYGLASSIKADLYKIKKYSIYVLSDMPITDSIKELSPTQINDTTIDYHVWDLHRLYAATSSQTGKEITNINLKDFTGKGIPCLEASQTSEYKAYLCNIPGKALAQIYNEYGSRLLEGNVRSFLEIRGKVNKGIRYTILNDPEKFFAYNNGIAATALDINTEVIDGVTYITEIKDLQIVNGGQTTASLATALLNDKRDNVDAQIEKIFVPMKLSIVSQDHSEELISNISRYANTQNKVSETDLLSNHPFHVKMEELSRRINAPALNNAQFETKWYYERTRGQYKQETYKTSESERKRFERINPKAQKIDKTQLAKYVNIFSMQPHIASAGGQKSFTAFAKNVSKQWEADNSVFNDVYFKNLVAMSILFKATDAIVKSQQWYTGSYKANIVAYTLSAIVYNIEKQAPEKAIDFKSIWEKQCSSLSWEKQLISITKTIYEFLTSTDRKIENVTEWAKRELCCQQSKGLDIILNEDFIDELIYKDEAISQAKQAKKNQKLVNNNLNPLIEVCEFKYWNEVLEWEDGRNVFTHQDREFINVALKIKLGKVPSDKQAKKILDVLNKARIEGFSK